MSIPLREPTDAIVVTEADLVREIKGKRAQLTILRRTNSLFDYFNLQKNQHFAFHSAIVWKCDAWLATVGAIDVKNLKLAIQAPGDRID